MQNHNDEIGQKALQELRAEPEPKDSEPDSEAAERTGNES